MIHLDNFDYLVEKIIHFSDFNKDGRVSWKNSLSLEKKTEIISDKFTRISKYLVVDSNRWVCLHAFIIRQNLYSKDSRHLRSFIRLGQSRYSTFALQSKSRFHDFF